MRVVGLTGGIGSGKSEVARRLETHGLPTIDADRVGHALLSPGHPTALRVTEAFGPGILTDGAIDRAKLGAVVFADHAQLSLLNALTHPPLAAEIRRQCAELDAAGHPAAIVDGAIIGDSGVLETWIDKLILVLSPASVRLKRLVDRRGLDPLRAQARIDAQIPPERKNPLAAWVIHNEGSLKELHAQVDTVAEEILRGHGYFG